MLRALPAIRGRTLDWLAGLPARYGPVTQFPVPGAGTYFVSGAEAVRDVLVTSARSYGKATPQYAALARVTGEGLLAADTAAWRRQRPVVQPAFHRAVVDGMAQAVDGAARDLVARWRFLAARDGAVIDVEPDLAALSVRVVGTALLGTRVDARARALVAATTAALDTVLAAVREPWSALGLPGPGRSRLRRALRTLDATVDEAVATRRATGPGPGPDLLDLLLAAGLDPREVRDQLVTFVVAGHETVAATLTWACGLLARDAAAAERLADGGADSPYARAVVDETLRLYPSAWVLTRRATVDERIVGVPVPAGSLVVLSPYVLHRDAAAWADPARFDPDRFAGADRPAAGSYVPFGAGPRQCIGRDLALLESVRVLAAVVRSLRLSAAGPLPPPDPRVSLRPRGGMPVRVGSRRGAGLAG